MKVSKEELLLKVFNSLVNQVIIISFNQDKRVCENEKYYESSRTITEQWSQEEWDSYIDLFDGCD